MKVRICIAVDDTSNHAAAIGWEIGGCIEDEPGDRWSLMEAAAKQNRSAGGLDPTRFIWAEVEIPAPEPYSPEEAKVIEVHPAHARSYIGTGTEGVG